MRRLVKGTTANTAPQPDCTNSEQTNTALKARNSGQLALICDNNKYPPVTPARIMLMLKRRPNLSLTQPPPGRATKFIKAKEPPSIAAWVTLKPSKVVI